jgi:hypothetical protein
MTGRGTIGAMIDVRGKHAELLVDPGAPAFGTGQFGICPHEQFEIAPAG